MRKTIVTLFSALAAVSPALWAQTPSATPQYSEEIQEAVFARVDNNKDGVISDTEFVVYVLKTSFETLDGDKDSMITQEEWIASEGPDGVKAFVKLDTDKDGRVSYTEFSSDPAKLKEIKALFRKIDPNKDAKVTEPEADQSRGKEPKSVTK